MMATRIGRTSIPGLLLRHLRHAWAPPAVGWWTLRSTRPGTGPTGVIG